MSSENRKPLYPQVVDSNPDATSPFQSSSSMYPSVDTTDLAENLFPDKPTPDQTQQPTFESSEEILIKIPGTIVHLIDRQQSIELASCDLVLIRLLQGDNIVAVLARVGEEIQWPLAKDEPAVKLDNSHYFFTLRVPADGEIDGADNLLNYGVTFASKGQENLLKELDGILEHYSAFSVQNVSSAVGGSVVAKEVSPAEMAVEGEKKLLMERSSSAYWTTLAPNVEDYSSSAAKLIAAGSGHVIRGILWCGDVTVDRLKWGNEFLKKMMKPGASSQISPQAMRRMKRVKKMTKTSENVATGILSGVVRLSGFFTSSIVNSKVGKKFFNLFPGEIVLASLDGFNKVCDAVEVSGRNVMSTTSTVTTGLVSHKYGEQAAEVTSHGLDAAGHAMGTAWAVFKIRKAINPKSVIKPTTLVKAAAAAEKGSTAKLK
jgi:spartin